jgi:hypothetical protein
MLIFFTESLHFSQNPPNPLKSGHQPQFRPPDENILPHHMEFTIATTVLNVSKKNTIEVVCCVRSETHGYFPIMGTNVL